MFLMQAGILRVPPHWGGLPNVGMVGWLAPGCARPGVQRAASRGLHVFGTCRLWGDRGKKGTGGQELACRLCVCTHSPAPLRACGAVGLVLRCVWAQACALLQANGFSVPGVDLYWKAVCGLESNFAGSTWDGRQASVAPAKFCSSPVAGHCPHLSCAACDAAGWSGTNMSDVCVCVCGCLCVCVRDGNGM